MKIPFATACRTVVVRLLPVAALAPLAFQQLPAQEMILPEAGQAPAIVVPKVPKTPVSLDLSGIDKSADPCTDFYAYACGNWRKNNPIPADKVRWGRFDELGEHNTYTVYQLLQEAAERPASPLQKKYGDYFAACMNDKLADTLGSKPIQPVLAAVDALKDKSGLAALVGATEARYGIGLFFSFGSQQDQEDSTRQIPGLYQGGINLPDRDYYLQQDERMSKLRDQYVEHVTKMFVLLGDTPARAAEEAAAVLRIETQLAQGSTDRTALRDPANRYHIKTLAELQSTTPTFQWSTYFSAIGVPITTLNVATPGFFTAFNSLLSSTSLGDLKSYLRWNIVHDVAGNLSSPFDQENFRFFAATLAGQKEPSPRWRRCTQATDRALGEAVGQDWVAKNFTPEAKANMLQLVKDLEASLGDDIRSLDWMSPATKTEALRKLSAFREKIGYPDRWRDYGALQVNRTDRVGNALRVSVFEDRRDLAKIGKPVDEREWSMTPPTVNAYYSPSNNDINFPAGILQPPFYDFHIDPAVNFGGIGVVIGHEMTHGFDDQGSKYDPSGNVRMWWTAEDKAAFDKRTDCEVAEYDGFEVAPGQKLNGKLTLGENTADNGGLQISYMALQKELARTGADTKKVIDGYTLDQRFFLGFGQLWCENTREETARIRAKTDPHSSGMWRVNGSVQNSARFATAWSCKAGQPMAPTNACRVW
jgi:putative endopeptidase